MARRRSLGKARYRGENGDEKYRNQEQHLLSDHTIQQSDNVRVRAYFSSDLLCMLHPLPGFPKRLEDVLEPDSSLFCILAEDVEGVSLEGGFYVREFWRFGLDFGRLGEGGAVAWIGGVGRVHDALEDGHVLAEGEIDRRYASRHRSRVEMRDFAHVGLCRASQEL
jgi:hypothetical protein